MAYSLISTEYNSGVLRSKLRRIWGIIRGLSTCSPAGKMQIVIKKLLAKFPQWGIAIVDGMLVKWEG
ncbi:hypothetical protein [Nostoc sp. UHCC 0252]|uniref:hypothetical protein n=1 Tax=Nostoc sp. UHCC 0252 TaxID=3110241 RepID=UPI002B1F836D|nr:hypothetical protein [Nostoc sp. UHCC 0252]MEA5605525.1 hypothetical protein [Nostoc sp. UHCC 0252]